jgi:hypothetical protein
MFRRDPPPFPLSSAAEERGITFSSNTSGGARWLACPGLLSEIPAGLKLEWPASCSLEESNNYAQKTAYSAINVDYPVCDRCDLHFLRHGAGAPHPVLGRAALSRNRASVFSNETNLPFDAKSGSPWLQGFRTSTPAPASPSAPAPPEP